MAAGGACSAAGQLLVVAAAGTRPLLQSAGVFVRSTPSCGACTVVVRAAGRILPFAWTQRAGGSNGRQQTAGATTAEEAAAVEEFCVTECVSE